MWKLLRKNRMGFQFRRQYPIGPYTVDFYCPVLKLVVEVDGEQHFDSFERDKVRDAYLSSFGIEVLRVPSLDIFDVPALTAWTQVIKDECERLSSKA